jgi:hypothetical protein
MREVIRHLGPPAGSFRYGKVRGLTWLDFGSDRRTWLLGEYPEGETFGGTDRLGMTVITDAVPFLRSLPPQDTLLLEGDRLFNNTFLRVATRDFDARLFLLTAPEEELAGRHVARGDTQSESWLKGRRTKVENLRKAYEWKELRSATHLDGARNLETVLKALD